jgi:hypothetical protein
MINGGILLRMGLGIKVTHQVVDVDYSEYLGENYRIT